MHLLCSYAIKVVWLEHPPPPPGAFACLLREGSRAFYSFMVKKRKMAGWCGPGKWTFSHHPQEGLAGSRGPVPIPG